MQPLFLHSVCQSREAVFSHKSSPHLPIFPLPCGKLLETLTELYDQYDPGELFGDSHLAPLKFYSAFY